MDREFMDQPPALCIDFRDPLCVVLEQVNAALKEHGLMFVAATDFENDSDSYCYDLLKLKRDK